jgi:hypothetical protein
LANVSKFFKAAFVRDFQEAKERTIHLTEANTKTFDIFVDWLYSSKLYITEVKPNNLSLEEQDWDDEQDDEIHEYSKRLTKLYIFADAHEIPLLSRVTIDALFELFCGENKCALPTSDTINRAFDHLPSTSPLLDLLVHTDCRYHSVTAGAEATEAARLLEDYPDEFLARSCVRQKVIFDQICKGDKELYYKLDICDYHGHADEKERSECPRKTSNSKQKPQLRRKR